MGVFKNGHVEIIPNDQGNRITPSYVAWEGPSGRRLVGDAAKNQATLNPASTVYDVKRLIGRDYGDAGVQVRKSACVLCVQLIYLPIIDFAYPSRVSARPRPYYYYYAG